MATEQHLLGFQREVSYLVQKQRAAFRLMEISFLGIVRTCKCTFDVSEESRTVQALWRVNRSPPPRMACLPVYFCRAGGGQYVLYLFRSLRISSRSYRWRLPALCGAMIFLKGGTFTGEYRHTALSCLTFFQYGTDQGDKFILHKLFGNIVYRPSFMLSTAVLTSA